ncbi:DNA phosphorothioation-dependent restriction protein DptF [Alteromonas sp. W364]|uniref:DNA phosphorothioation-dependent restriction protein DptF n=1 Tax=Alteromonas sp. W364 TaxID=3075610 RepID=UPI0028847D5C|nr:DNA phosphorothioation-dependent restriction protein DptF [Alteromonas sp. W364]MDT0628079.1 DNA phosphorothioation-dependent restriction protein DptF [Alteromonas sp. W364]
MRFKEILSVLSKSSPYAVSTERDQAISEQLDAVKRYLYIPTDIEQDFKAELDSASQAERKIIFLCGSSGDGKSEILTRYSKEYSKAARFHLDATHSFDPNTTAIQTLDKLFDEFQSSLSSLVVGINIGMLGNYAQEGNNEHISKAINQFLNGSRRYGNVTFLNFEDYAKFRLDEAGHTSEFIQKVFDKITSTHDNPIRDCFTQELSHSNTDKKLCANYRLLSIPQVQHRIIEVLFKTRLMKDQFLTARTLLDFIHCILVGPGTSTGYLFDNLFEESDNELSSNIVAFDPADIRTNAIDKFVLSYSLGIKDDEFETYTSYLSTELGIRKPNKPRPNSYLRLFYLLKDTEINNQYHSRFKYDFAEDLIDRYSKVWNMHQNYTGVKEERDFVRAFYRDTVIAAVHRYNNRNATNLNKGQFLTSEHNDYQIVAEVALKPNLEAVNGSQTTTPAFFLAHIKLDDKPFEIPININLLKLLEDIVNGYRPNKHDKNTVVLLDDLVDRISDIAVNADELMIVRNDVRYTLKNIDDEDIEVSGL